MYHIVYKTTNLINSKIYIGVHSSKHLTDRYLGSGVILSSAIKKYGRSSFIRENLFVFDTVDKAYNKEAELVNEEFVLRNDTYNAAVGGNGGNRHFRDVKSTNKRISMAQKERMASPDYAPWNLGKKCPEIGRAISKTRKERGISYSGKNNPMYGVDLRTKLTEDEIKLWGERISKSLKGKKRSDEAKKKYSDAAKARKWLIHRSGLKSSTTDPNDPRLSDKDWQLGRKWKDQ